MVIGNPVCTALKHFHHILMVFIRNIERYSYAFHDNLSVLASRRPPFFFCCHVHFLAFVSSTTMRAIVMDSEMIERTRA
jgi:hypothetical protein